MKRYNANRSCYKDFSGDQGYLYPIMWQEVLPGESWRHQTSCLVRTSPLLAPVMHPVHVTIHHWFVPYRLLWDAWETFITGGPLGDADPAFPTMTVNTGSGHPIGSLADFLGVPTGVDDITYSALPFRAYNLIYNNFYRDEQLVPQLPISKASGADTTTSFILLQRAWQKDRFTAARPDPQLGPDITIPLQGQVPINRTPSAGAWVGYKAGTDTPADQPTTDLGFNTGTRLHSDGDDISLDPDGGLFGELADTANPGTILQLREAFALERFWENRNKFGGRYNEYLMALGVRPSDARLQLPEYLGGGTETLQFSEVLSTAETEVDTDYTPVGALKGHGIGSAKSNRYQRFFEEHGLVMTMFSVKPITMYFQGLHKKWNRRTKFDFWQPELQNIGQEAILNKEVKVDHADPDGVWGWTNRNDDMRHTLSEISGEFRTTLDFWHMARKFDTDPGLNSQFVLANPTDRIYSTGSASNQLLVMAHHKVKSKTPVPPSSKGFVR